MMKKILFIIFIVSFGYSNAQFKEQLNQPIDYKGGILNGNSSSLFGFINPQNFSMNHTFDLSFQTFYGGSFALGVYTNSMMYKFSDNLNIEADLSIVNSPYSSIGKEFSNQVNGFYLSRAQLNYKPSENTSIIIQYRNIPMTYYSPYSYYGRGYSPFYGYGYNDFDFRSGK